MNLKQHSIEVVLSNQTDNGAYLASPNFPTYRYCWFRDGAFIAYSMDIVGEFDSAGRFHDWVAQRICDMSSMVDAVLDVVTSGGVPSDTQLLHTRYAPSGEPADEEWPNHQLDGFGTWLWALERHHSLAGTTATTSQVKAARIVAKYLTALWDKPCYDCWEEYGDKLHAYTLGAVHGGLNAYEALTGEDQSLVLQSIREFIDISLVDEGRFVKFVGSDAVDASLIGLAVPYGVVPVDDDRMARTIAEIESVLRRTGGVHRYLTDTYYGGGEWILLTSWLAWYYYLAGNVDLGNSCMEWVESRANETLDLPEQVTGFPIDSTYVEPWLERWGPVATPLVWSHAMYLIADSVRPTS